MSKIRKVASAMGRSMWMWLFLLVLGGCALTEGLRQSAYVGRIRAQDGQQLAGETRILAARSQEALNALSASIPEEVAVQLRPHIRAVAEAQEAIVERAAKLETSSMRSEEWQTAATEALGDPKQPVRPDTPEEDDARADFQRAARTAGRVRAMGHQLGAMAGIPQSNSQPQAQADGILPLAVGGLTALAGGSGLLALARRMLRGIKLDVETAKAKADGHESSVEELKAQVSRLTQTLEELQKLLAARPAPASSPPSPLG